MLEIGNNNLHDIGVYTKNGEYCGIILCNTWEYRPDSKQYMFYLNEHIVFCGYGNVRGWGKKDLDEYRFIIGEEKDLDEYRFIIGEEKDLDEYRFIIGE
jgi:hypothetical protein